MIDKNIIENLAASIADGTASEEVKGLVLKAVQTQMSCTLLASLNETNRTFSALSDLLTELIGNFTDSVRLALNSDSMSRKEVFDTINLIQDRQLQFVDMYRKIVQSPKTLFAENSISEEEKKVLKLFQSFKTDEEKLRFIQICEESYRKLNNESTT